MAPGTNVSLRFRSPFAVGHDELPAQPVALFDLTVSKTSSQTAEIATMLTFPNAPAHVVTTVHGLVPPPLSRLGAGLSLRLTMPDTASAPKAAEAPPVTTAMPLVGAAGTRLRLVALMAQSG